jgi:hypothetical protein
MKTLLIALLFVIPSLVDAAKPDLQPPTPEEEAVGRVAAETVHEITNHPRPQFPNVEYPELHRFAVESSPSPAKILSMTDIARIGSQPRPLPDAE